MIDPVGSAYPMRALVRHKAKAKLIEGIEFQDDCPLVDEDLLRDLATTLFQSKQAQDLYTQCHSRHEADEIENRFATELVETYKQIKQQEANPLVQLLNGLL
ncbi:hypothetical protein H6G89_09700 [Oscillatoria sp. FACHB-1407]|uniref:hypothetical protein n=1 Tax=Oscillatoria sp. FACHB-1407 TaxID=2692847 RepID=UPI0016883351|nr:hypothetical protein [Oscillatoria sp. FACHB-1407]MBD2461320.1 hypothetical protein [Oscillatoria sp. FACHB-1407]